MRITLIARPHKVPLDVGEEEHFGDFKLRVAQTLGMRVDTVKFIVGGCKGHWSGEAEAAVGTLGLKDGAKIMVTGTLVASELRELKQRIQVQQALHATEAMACAQLRADAEEVRLGHGEQHVLDALYERVLKGRLKHEHVLLKIIETLDALSIPEASIRLAVQAHARNPLTNFSQLVATHSRLPKRARAASN